MLSSHGRQITPLIMSGVAAVAFGLSFYFFFHVYNSFMDQKEMLQIMQTRVRVTVAHKEELIQKQRFLNQTIQFLNSADAAGMSLSKWTDYNVNLQEIMTFEKADQILNQCSSTQVAYFHPISLQIKTTKEGLSDVPGVAGDLILSIQGKFVARQP